MIFRILLALGLFLALPVSAGGELAFPGAEGYGRYTQGGRGGQVLVVNSLEDDASNPRQGTLRHALKQQGPRIIVFDVSGVIHLQKPLEIKHGYVTLAGQSSPGGIVISGAETEIEADQVIIRYLRFRPGKGQGQGDALTARGRHNIIIDHCSLSWANDEIGSFYNNTNFTLQHSILSESLNDAGHSKGRHGYGGIWGGRRASFVHNLLASHLSRNPRINGYRLGAPYDKEEELTDVRNNVIFNWGDNSAYGGEGGRFNLVNNYYRPGPASRAIRFFQLWGNQQVPGLAYIQGNWMDGYPQLSADNRLGIHIKGVKNPSTTHPLLVRTLVDKPFGNTDSGSETAAQSWQYLIIGQEVGANRNRQGRFADSVDRRILDNVRDNQVPLGNGIIDTELQVISHWSAYADEFTAAASPSALAAAKHMQQWLDELGKFPAYSAPVAGK